nr:immunoglobulin heavy chain junction region [Macaca mulatta]MOV39283.1 immunoglobulin heavy chain junction region [Macaca mulatta]MOV40010.1 immunoglobulin heavy chain junction region [Macaca mulatta]MOV40754.1 immunoglobulin heavy chain junction region [Macaca mulatta]MOV41247.1 immunoglobulin heavy chain junction region [Macaca mulatta]
CARMVVSATMHYYGLDSW